MLVNICTCSQFIAALQPFSWLVFISVLRYLMQVIAVAFPWDGHVLEERIPSNSLWLLTEIGTWCALSELRGSWATVDLRILVLRYHALILKYIVIHPFSRRVWAICVHLGVGGWLHRVLELQTGSSWIHREHLVSEWGEKGLFNAASYTGARKVYIPFTHILIDECIDLIPNLLVLAHWQVRDRNLTGQTLLLLEERILPWDIPISLWE